MNISAVFPTVIAHTVDIDMADMLLPIAKKYLSDEEYVNYNLGYKNTYSSGFKLAKEEDLKQFCDFIISKGMEFMETMGYDIKTFSLKPQIFFGELKDGESHGRHIHPDSLLSGIVYLQVPQGSGDLIFTDPRPVKQFGFVPQMEGTIYNTSKFVVNPEKGLFLIWESWLEHEITTCKNKEDGRISIVFNLIKEFNG